MDEVLKFFSKYIEKELGIVYADFNQFQLIRRLEEVSRTLGYASVEDFYQATKSGLSEVNKQILLDAATNNETSFFRDRPVFDIIEKTILPEVLIKNKGAINIWCAASSYGQEPVSLSILMSELNANGSDICDCKITATDICKKVLSRAQEGLYSQLDVQRGLPMPTLIKYFKPDGLGWWKVNDRERKRIHYATQNLCEPFTRSVEFDVILCRNVLIYQGVPNKTEIIKKMESTIKPGGYLILGAGESLLGIPSRFQYKNIDGVVVYQKPA